MTQSRLPFQYQGEKKESGLTGYAGLPLYSELLNRSGFIDYINRMIRTKVQGWTDAEMIVSIIMLNISGGDCITDIERLERDSGFKTLMLEFATNKMKRKEREAYEQRWRSPKERGLPSTAVIHRYLSQFHNEAEEAKREEGSASGTE